jgi:hypothetical protein
VKAVHPAVCAFHHPAPCLEPSLPDGQGFFAPAADMRSESELQDDGVYLAEVIAPLSRQMPWGSASVGTGLLAMRLARVFHTGFMSWRLAPSMAMAIGGMLLVSVSRLRLTPCLPRSVGFGPFFRVGERCLRHRAIHGQSRPVYTLEFVMGREPPFSRGTRTPCRPSIPESAGMPSCRSRCRWRSGRSNGKPCTQDEEDGFMAFRSGTLGLWHPRGWGLRGERRGSICRHSLSLIRQPSSFAATPMGFSCCSFGEGVGGWSGA